MTKRIGYEAQLANINYKMTSVEEMGVNLHFEGYSDKLFTFIEEYLDILFECSEKDWTPDEVLNSVETIGAEYTNSNLDVADHATNNRLLFLIPHTYHNSLIEKVLKKKLKEAKQDDFKGFEEFNPSALLKDILQNISSIQLLVLGNTPFE